MRILIAAFFVAFGLLIINVYTAHASYNPTKDTIMYTTAELKANIHKGPKCIHIDNQINHAYYSRNGVNGQGGGFDYTDIGSDHIVWVIGTPAWMAARTETAFSVISKAQGTGIIKGWTCVRYKASQVPT